MVPLQIQLFTLFPSKSPTNAFHHHRLLSTTAATTITTTSLSSSNYHFAVDEYLVNTLQFSRTEALKISKNLPHIKSPSKPASVISFLIDLGLTTSDIAKVTASEPMILCISVDEVMIPRLEILEDFGFSQSQIARLIVLAPGPFRRPSVIRKIQYWLNLFGSVDTLLKALKKNHYLLTSSLDKVVDPNVQLLQRQCGLSLHQIAKMVVTSPRLLTTNPELVHDIVLRAEEFGIPRKLPMFQYALSVTSCQTRETVEMKVEVLKTALGLSDPEVRELIRRLPMILSSSKERLKRVTDFLMNEVGLEGQFVASNPALFTYSVKRRMAPRHYVIKELWERNLLPLRVQMMCNIIKLTEEKFLAKYVDPYKESIPELADAYSAACASKEPAEVEP